MKKTREQLESEIALGKCLEIEREVSDKLYAIKLVEKIVFGMVGLILTAVVVALIALVLK